MVKATRKFSSWAFLNEGKKIFGSVFPDGKVPVRSIFEHNASLASIKDLMTIPEEDEYSEQYPEEG